MIFENNKKAWVLSALAASLWLPSADSAQTRSAPVVPPILDAQAIDHAQNPCQNFYQFACGKWLKDLEIPADKPAYMHQSGALEDQSNEDLRGILESYSKGKLTPKSRYAEKLGAFYTSCVDEGAVAKASPHALKEKIKQIDSIHDTDGFADALASLHREGVFGFFDVAAAQDYLDSSKVIAHLEQNGMSLPEKNYYLKTDAESLKTITQLKAHVAKMFRLIGEAPKKALQDAATAVDLEKTLAEGAYSLADRMDTSKLSHPATLNTLGETAPIFPWSDYFKKLGLSEDALKAINIEEPEYFTGFNKVIADTSRHALWPQIKAYLKWQYLHARAHELPVKYEAEDFDFWLSKLNGQKEMEPRWKRCMRIVKLAMPEAVGEAYVSLIPSAETIRAKAREVAERIKSEFDSNLSNITWLDEATRGAAHLKLSKVTQKIGYPDQWRNYDSLQISKSSLLGNMTNAVVFEVKRNLTKIGKPLDRTEWMMPVWEDNAYYDPSMNEMVFPIGGLIPPIFDINSSDGANFGALGATMGHELTHGFDTNGSQMDSNGNLKNWWSKETLGQFNQKTKCFADQASLYEILPSLKVNGPATLTENVADQGGTKLALKAFQRRLRGRGESPKFEGLGELQQFFLSYAQSWCLKRTPDNLRKLVLSNEHPPEEYRVNGVLSNIPEFAQAFSCGNTPSLTVARDRCSAW